jgi:hypothetical protein
MSEGEYDAALICPNGHVVNARANTQRQHNQKFCDKCGEAVLIKCAGCSAPIRGRYYGGNMSMPYTVPSYCFNRGEQFAWSRRELDAAKELADEFDELSWEEKESLKQSLDDLMRDTPQTKVAETRFKRLIKKAGNHAYEGMRDILVDVLSEAAKKTLFGV